MLAILLFKTKSGNHETISLHNISLYPPQTKLWGYIVILTSFRSFVRSFVRSSVRPSQSLIRYSFETTEQNFMKFSGIFHTAPLILKIYSNYFRVSQSKTRTLPYKTWGSGGYRSQYFQFSFVTLLVYLYNRLFGFLHSYTTWQRMMTFVQPEHIPASFLHLSLKF